MALLALGCFRSSSGGDDGGVHVDAGRMDCDCCGTSVTPSPRESCATTCAPFCGPDAGTELCNCCGTLVEVPAGDGCGLHCDPFCPGDAGVDAPPLTCPSERIDLACYGFLAEGRDNALELLVGGDGGCYCGETIECRATVVAPGRLAIETAVCPGLCEACFPFGGPARCELPPLTEGVWSVSVNGAPAFTTNVGPAGVAPERGEICHRVADQDDCAELPSRPFEASRLCVSSGGFPDERVAIRVVDPCGGCGTVRGECRVETFGDVVRVRPERLGISCDVDCPAVCIEREDVCWTPPLPPGTYRVMLEGSDESLTLSVGGGTADDQCLEVGTSG
jgi:hypothetical protein